MSKRAATGKHRGSGIVPLEIIERRIYLVRGQKVMLDSDLAELYGVPTKSLNLAVHRNINRFPADFMFRLSVKETESLRFQFETSKTIGRGGRRYLPYAFTEQGVAMLSSVLKSERAVLVNIAIMRVFVRLRRMLSDHAELLRRLDILEGQQQKQSGEIKAIFEAIRKLLEPTPIPPEEEKPPIGFRPPKK